MLPKRPINADVPAPEEAREKAAPAPDAPVPEARVHTPEARPKPLAPKLLAALVLLAIVFVVVAIVGGSGGEEAGAPVAPAPTAAPSGGGDGSEASGGETAEALGYPGFATDNTTRIGGSDPAANAAAAALAVFPSTTRSQRPAAVTVVGEEDWAGGIAAAVLMAPPARAPLLVSTPDEVPEATAAALEALDPQGSSDTAGAAIFAIGAVSLPDDTGQTARVDSGDPASTAAQIATLRDRVFDEAPAHIVVAPSSRPDFAMPAAAWAARSGDPVLYAGAEELPQPTATVLRRHPKVPVYVLGPPSAISAAVVREIDEVAGRVERVAGGDPVANALALARYRDRDFGWNVNDPGHGFVLARSDSPLDAAAAAPLSAAGTWGPLLLTDDAGTLPAALRDYFLDVKPGYTTDPTRAFYNHVWVIGDQEAIDVSQQAEVNALAELARIGGEP